MLQQVRKSGLLANFKRSLFVILFQDEVSFPFHLWLNQCKWVFHCREHDKKVCCLGLISLLALPADQLPDDALGRIFRATLDLLVKYKDQVAGL